MKTWIVEDCTSGVVYLVKADYPDAAEKKVLATIDIRQEYDEYCKSLQYIIDELQKRGHATDPLPSFEEYVKDYVVETRQEFKLDAEVVPLEEIVGEWF